MCVCVCLSVCVCVSVCYLCAFMRLPQFVPGGAWGKGRGSSAFCLQKCLMITAGVMLLYDVGR